jgi:Putative metal-binding motif/Secretion system C-terminal sorting domain
MYKMIKTGFLAICLLLLLCITSNTSIYAQCNPTACELPGNGIDEDCDGFDELFLKLPPRLFAVEGRVFQLNYQNTFLSKHAQDYGFHVESMHTGTFTPEKWSFTPSSSQVGITKLKLYILDQSGNTLASDSTDLVVSAATSPINADSSKILLLGHSFLDQGYLPYYLYNATHSTGNVPITFHGKKTSWANNSARHEGHGSRSWRWFKEDSISPFFVNRPVHIQPYFNQIIGQNKAPDQVVIYLDVNDFLNYTDLNFSTLQAIDDTIDFHWEQYAKPILDSMRVYAPNAKFGYCMVPPCAAKQEPFDSLGLAVPRLNDRWRWQRIVSRLHIKVIETYGNRESEGYYVIPTHLNFSGQTDYSNADPVHPRPGNLLPGQSYGGYNKVSESIYAWLKFVESGTQLGYPFYADQDGDGFGNPANMTTATTLPAGYVTNQTDCDDTNATIYPGATELCGNNTDENCNGTLNEDQLPPTARCKTGTVNLFLGEFGDTFIDPVLLDNGSDDQCTQVLLKTNPEALNCQNVGSNTIMLSVQDSSGNTDSCTVSVFLQDNKAPILGCTDKFVQIGPNKNASFNTRSGLTYWFDNCALDSSSLVTQTIEYTCNDVDSIYLHTLQVLDTYGNMAQCSYVVLVKDYLDQDADGTPNCADLCPYDAQTASGYTWFVDMDGDSFGSGMAQTGCVPPASSVSSGTDCDDTNPNINPAALEIFNNAYDEDCNGVVDSTINSTYPLPESSLELSPNPAMQLLRVTSERNIQSVHCTSSMGQLVFQLAGISQQNTEIQVGDLNTGFYFLEVRFEDGKRVVKRWVKD